MNLNLNQLMDQLADHNMDLNLNQLVKHNMNQQINLNLNQLVNVPLGQVVGIVISNGAVTRFNSWTKIRSISQLSSKGSLFLSSSR